MKHGLRTEAQGTWRSHSPYKSEISSDQIGSTLKYVIHTIFTDGVSGRDTMLSLMRLKLTCTGLTLQWGEGPCVDWLTLTKEIGKVLALSLSGLEARLMLPGRSRSLCILFFKPLKCNTIRRCLIFHFNLNLRPASQS